MPELGKPGSGGWFTVVGMGLLAAFPDFPVVAAIGRGVAMGALFWLVLKEGGRPPFVRN
jgi:hypothetical protein